MTMSPLCLESQPLVQQEVGGLAFKRPLFFIEARLLEGTRCFLGQDTIFLGLAQSWKVSFVTHSKMEQVHLGEPVTDGSSSSQVP